MDDFQISIRINMFHAKEAKIKAFLESSFFSLQKPGLKNYFTIKMIFLTTCTK